jgi:hypothetical protein
VVIALIAVGLVVVLTGPGGPTAGPSPAPSSVSTPSVAPLPSISVAPATAATSAEPTRTAPRLTAPPTQNP